MRKLSIVAIAALAISGCATEEYVNKQIASANKRMDGQQAEMSGKLDKQAQDAAGRHQALEGKVDSQHASVSKTAQEALDRANAAGKLAEGKFMFETVLSGQVAFGLNSSNLTAAGKKALDDLVAKLKADNKNVYLEIQGHTDNSGSNDANLRLAQKRAEAVHRYLAINGGIALHRMAAMSYGEAAPIADNKTRAGRIENRRVTVVVLQ
jgi:peptidoglycan-associated lipoprotein